MTELSNAGELRRQLESAKRRLAFVVAEWDAQEEPPDDVVQAFEDANNAIDLILTRLYMARVDRVRERRGDED